MQYFPQYVFTQRTRRTTWRTAACGRYVSLPGGLHGTLEIRVQTLPKAQEQGVWTQVGKLKVRFADDCCLSPRPSQGEQGYFVSSRLEL